MSAILNRVPGRDSFGRINGHNATTAPDHFHNGLGYHADGRLSVHVGGTPDHYSQGLPITANGRLALVAEAAVDHFQSGAAPIAANGALIHASNGTHHVHGVWYIASPPTLAAVCFTLTT